MNISITQLVYLICFIQVLTFSIFLIRNIKKCKPNTYLAIFFVAQLIIVGRQFAGLFCEPEIQNYIYKLTYPSFWVVVPSVIMYIQSTIFSEFRFAKFHLLHFIPSTLMFIYCLTYALQLYMQDQGMMSLISFKENDIMEKISAYSMYIYFLIYTLWTLRIIRHYKSAEDSSRYQKRVKTIRWLMLFVNSFFVSWLVNAIIIYAYNLKWLPETSTLAPLIMILPFFIFFNIVFYIAWENPRQFIVSEERTRDYLIETDEKKFKKYITQLSNYMSSDRPYLDPDLSMNRLAEQLRIPIKDLSRIINSRFNQNFNDFINYYRTKEVTDALSKSDKLDTDLVSLALDCGFNSKASFFRIFKKNTGLTPRQFFDNIQFKKQEVLSEAC
jgi:AraC-like DNA-binding protein